MDLNVANRRANKGVFCFTLLSKRLFERHIASEQLRFWNLPGAQGNQLERRWTPAVARIDPSDRQRARYTELVRRFPQVLMVTATGQLTTHVLDTARGCPAAGLRVELWFLDGLAHRLIATMCTNADGRTDKPLLAAGALRGGLYELVFGVGAYFRAQALALPEPLFLDSVPVRFGVADPDAHYHVPLLVSPWSYSTYRGS